MQSIAFFGIIHKNSVRNLRSSLTGAVLLADLICTKSSTGTEISMDDYNYDENDNTIKQQTPQQQESQQESQQAPQQQVPPQMSQQQTPPYMQQQFYHMPPQMQPAHPQPKNGFGTASLVFGILAIPGCMTVWFGIIFAVMAIVFAIISRINMGRFDGKTTAGLTLGILFLILSLLLFWMVLVMLQNPEFMEQMNSIMQQYQQEYSIPYDGTSGNTLHIMELFR